MKSKIICLFLFVSLAFCIQGCGSAPLNITSKPSAQVFMSSNFSEKGKQLGKTPQAVSFKDQGVESEFVLLTFEEEGYEPYRIVIPSKLNIGSVDVNLVQKEKYLEPEVKKKVETDNAARELKMVNETLEIQKLLQAKQVTAAEARISQLKAVQAPEALIATLEGNIAYLKGQTATALASYQKALQLNPENRQLIEAIAWIKQGYSNSNGRGQ